MNKKDYDDFWKGMAVMALFLGIMLGISASAWMHDSEQNMSDVTCYANPSSFLITEGWMRLHEADRQRIGNLIKQDQAEWKYEPSLICRDVTTLNRIVVNEWWWKRK